MSTQRRGKEDLRLYYTLAQYIQTIQLANGGENVYPNVVLHLKKLLKYAKRLRNLHLLYEVFESDSVCKWIPRLQVTSLYLAQATRYEYFRNRKCIS